MTDNAQNNQAKYITSTNPAKDYEIIGKVLVSSKREVAQAVQNARETKRLWKEMGVKKRVEILRTLYDEFSRRKEEIIHLIIEETGKTVRFANLEFDRYAKDFAWFLDNGEKALADQITFEDEKSIHKIVYEPRGIAAVITPWNYPYGMFVWGVIPNLIAGNTVVYKASEECPLCGKLIDEIMSSQNLPNGVFNAVYGAGDIGTEIIDQDIDFIWFTGSTTVGKNIYKKAAEKFIGAVMELGGSNPAIMFEDVIVDDCIEKIYAKRFTTCGQACDALKRLLVHEAIFDEVVTKLQKRLETVIVGHPEDAKTDLASLVAKRQVDLLEAQVNDALAKGAKLLYGGKRPGTLQGAYYLPTLLTNINRSMRIWHEETFGPVLVILPFKDEEQALSLANETRYGLGSIVFTKDKKRAYRVATRIESGNVEINGAIHWLPCNPFGGYKDSGIGREHGEVGLRELCQIKTLSAEKE